MTKIGNVVDVVLHTKAHPLDCEKARRQKQKHTTLAQQARNDKSSASYMALVALGNFTGRDLYITLTYDEEHIPGCTKAVKADGERFIRRLRGLWRDLGTELRYIRVIEGLQGGARYHHHMIVNWKPGANIGALRTVLESLWPYGAVHTERISSKPGRTAYDLALYFYKEVKAYDRPAGSRAFSCSTNLDRGETDTVIVPDGLPVEVPAEVPMDNVLVFEKQQLLFSRYVHLRYIVPGARYGLEQAITSRQKKPKRKG